MRFSFYLLFSVLLVACSKHPTILGNFSAGQPASISELATNSSPNSVVVSGKLIEKCPIAGCWFYLEDKTGRIKVDTKSAGFVVLDVPLGKEVEVSGTVARNGSEKLIEAQGLKF